MLEKIFTIEQPAPQEVYGANNIYLDILKTRNPEIKFIARGNELKIQGKADIVTAFTERMELFLALAAKSKKVDEGMFLEVFGDLPPEITEEGNLAQKELLILYGNNAKPIKAKTRNQVQLVKDIESNDVVFAIGPAGTGKTFTAVAVAVKALKNKEIKRIILTRPAVEAGENLGFLPGDLKDKIDPYLRPLYDALEEMIPPDKLKQYMESRVIEIAPMAFMRGRTLDNSFVILDEAQNATDMQLKMFLTRMGPNAKLIITGDLSQIDLPKRNNSGLLKAVRILSDIKGIKIMYLSVDDVVRHRLVKQIINAYEKHSEKDNSNDK